jgi:hypothetical protein
MAKITLRPRGLTMQWKITIGPGSRQPTLARTRLLKARGLRLR